MRKIRLSLLHHAVLLLCFAVSGSGCWPLSNGDQNAKNIEGAPGPAPTVTPSPDPSPTPSATPAGALHAGFGSGGKVRTNHGRVWGRPESLQASAVQSDGKVVLAGTNVNTDGEYELMVARVLSDGGLDASFGTDGVATAHLDSEYRTTLSAVAIQSSDGKIVAAGAGSDGGIDYGLLVRFNADGSLDSSFGDNGKVKSAIRGTTCAFFSLRILDNGKILVAGLSDNPDDFTDEPLIARFNANGTLDTAFGSSGFVAESPLLGYGDGAYMDLALQSDGSILAGGYHGMVGMITRYNASGVRDTTFGDADGVNTGYYFSNGVSNGIVRLAVVGGDKVVALGTGGAQFSLLRFDADVSAYDNAFSGDGKLQIPVGNYVHPTSMAIDPGTGQLLVGGYYSEPATNFFALAVRVNPDGTLDGGFDADGVRHLPTVADSSFGMSIHALAGGKVLLAGTTVQNTGATPLLLVRLTGAGALDTAFDGDGVGYVDFTLDVSEKAEQSAFSMATQADGKIVAAGYTVGLDSQDFLVTRYNQDGTLDTGFGTGGKAQTNLGGYDQAWDVAVAPSGKIVVAGVTDQGGGTSRFAVVQYNSDGTLDTAFGTGGIVIQPLGDDAYARKVALLPGGKILVAGTAWVTAAGNYAVALLQLNADGSIDTDFSDDGIVVDSGGLSSVAVNAVLALATGKIVVGGYAVPSGTQLPFLMRLNADGTFDTSVGDLNDGVATTLGMSDGGEIHALKETADGMILATGYAHPSDGSGYRLMLARFNSDLTPDPAFQGTGWRMLTLPTGYTQGIGQGLAILPSGKIVIGGYALSETTGWDLLAARFGADGALDTAFGAEGRTLVDFAGDDDQGYGVGLLPDGSIVVGGDSKDLATTGADFALIRLTH